MRKPRSNMGSGMFAVGTEQASEVTGRLRLSWEGRRLDLQSPNNVIRPRQDPHTVAEHEDPEPAAGKP
ncbi:hypothetical protein MesoLjLc_39340 [Mesorhizobium sp. L-8-10]|nr:hypothetical protein MesoLjLc_39340 [Mesorhizobium sp. L-8-10]